jgi:phosphoribosylanthranilate isomerase
MNLKLKVCGMRENQNMKDVLALNPDFMGFIFFEKSPRNLDEHWNPEILQDYPKDTKKVGVFVNAEIETVVEKVRRYQLDMVQLHGKETVDYCQKLMSLRIPVMKAFSVDKDFDFNDAEKFQNVCTQFLFDTKAEGGYGGHGKSFDWNLLEKYTLNVPFLLAGGIDLDNLKNLQIIKNKAFVGLDVNSRFEVRPANKDIAKLTQLRKELDRLNAN